MTIRAGRLFLAITGAVFVVASMWAGLAWILAGAQDAVVPTVLAALAGVVLGTGMLIIPRFAETSINRGRLTVRFVLRPRRCIELTDIDEVVLLQSLQLPSSSAGPMPQRIVLRQGGRTLLVFTPQDVAVAQELRGCGLPLTIVPEALTPAQACHRYPKSASIGERIISPMPWLAIAISVVVVGWLLWKWKFQ